MQDQLLDRWAVHHRIHLSVLDKVRLMWLQSAAPDGLQRLEKIEKTHTVDKDLLEQSNAAIASLLRQGFEAGKIRGFKPHPAGFTGYRTAHESYHRGKTGIILPRSGHPLDKKITFGMWEWGVK